MGICGFGKQCRSIYCLALLANTLFFISSPINMCHISVWKLNSDTDQPNLKRKPSQKNSENRTKPHKKQPICCMICIFISAFPFFFFLFCVFILKKHSSQHRRQSILSKKGTRVREKQTPSRQVNDKSTIQIVWRRFDSQNLHSFPFGLDCSTHALFNHSLLPPVLLTRVFLSSFYMGCASVLFFLFLLFFFFQSKRVSPRRSFMDTAWRDRLTTLIQRQLLRDAIIEAHPSYFLFHLYHGRRLTILFFLSLHDNDRYDTRSQLTTWTLSRSI